VVHFGAQDDQSRFLFMNTPLSGRKCTITSLLSSTSGRKCYEQSMATVDQYIWFMSRNN
jgi:hypothetical protein